MDAMQAARAVIAKVGRRAPESLSEDQSLVADLGIDSARALQLLADLEDALGVEIADEDAARMNTVGDVLAYARRLEATA
jgi:acyl carrier protein